MRGADSPPGSKATPRAKELHRNLGGLVSDRLPFVPQRFASGRGGAVADDARAREVGSSHSSDEIGEQSRVTGGGTGGAKGEDRGKRDRRHMRAGHSTGTTHGERSIADQRRRNKR